MFDMRLALTAALPLAVTMSATQAQELEPRAYSNAPIGFNFLIAGYAHSRGGLSFDPALPIEDARLKIDSGLFAYARVIDLWGKSGKFDVVLPYSRLSGSATVAGELADRQISGFSEPRLRLSVNLYGAPALSMREFASYQKDLVIGASVQVSAPSGQYDPSRAINLGSNRWTIKPDVGFSKAFDALTLDFTASATFYGDNDDYYGGKKLAQANLYSAQTNISYDFSGGAWAALGYTYYRGARTTVNGVPATVELANSRVGIVLAIPVNKHHSIKLSASDGVNTSTGSDFAIGAVVWQYRWADGF